jgi:hypothetical protein
MVCNHYEYISEPYDESVVGSLERTGMLLVAFINGLKVYHCEDCGEIIAIYRNRIFDLTCGEKTHFKTCYGLMENKSTW